MTLPLFAGRALCKTSTHRVQVCEGVGPTLGALIIPPAVAREVGAQGLFWVWERGHICLVSPPGEARRGRRGGIVERRCLSARSDQMECGVGLLAPSACQLLEPV